MKKIARNFSQEDYSVKNWGYPSKEKTIEAHASDLVASLQDSALKSPKEPIHFITHSLGGIILRCALNHPDCPQEAKIGKAVLLAPPNQGSRFAQFLRQFRAVQEIFGAHAGHQILYKKNFNDLGEFPESIQVLIISGTFGWNPFVGEVNDGKLGVSESCLNTPHKHIRITTSHSWMMYSPQVIRSAKQFIQSR